MYFVVCARRALGLYIPQTILQLFLGHDRLAPRARSAAVRQNPRPLGRGQGELYKNVYLPYREVPPFRAGRLHT
jgi:hypothetical protein